MPITRLTLSSLLSFGPGPTTVDLGPLNVLIGPNGSGKSNLIDALSLLRAATGDLAEPFRVGGGQFRDWVWSGAGAQPGMRLGTVVSPGDSLPTIAHDIELAEHLQRPRVVSERVAWVGERATLADPEYVRSAGMSRLVFADGRTPPVRDVSENQSVLATHAVTSALPPASKLRDTYAAMRLYRGFDWGRDAKARTSQRGDLPPDFLLPTAENLAAVLSALQLEGVAFEHLKHELRRFMPDFRDLLFVNLGPQLLVYLRLDGLSAPVPLSRMSDGTLRYLSLLAVLLHPRPPGLLCIEEPETGLHPDMIADLARHLAAASERTQVVVTTHSDLLVSALSHRPDAVVVVERGPQGTELNRLEPARLAAWLEKYSLGELWLKGEIGGSR